MEGVSFDQSYIFDFTTISMFSDIIKGVGRNPRYKNSLSYETNVLSIRIF